MHFWNVFFSHVAIARTLCTHFSLACASDGTVDPLPLAYIVFCAETYL